LCIAIACLAGWWFAEQAGRSCQYLVVYGPVRFLWPSFLLPIALLRSTAFMKNTNGNTYKPPKQPTGTHKPGIQITAAAGEPKCSLIQFAFGSYLVWLYARLIALHGFQSLSSPVFVLMTLYQARINFIRLFGASSFHGSFMKNILPKRRSLGAYMTHANSRRRRATFISRCGLYVFWFVDSICIPGL
jgi:hypothetical protein